MARNCPRGLLLIDDEPAQAGLISALAARAAWRVARASDIASALNMIRSADIAIDAALIDLWSPDIASTDSIAALRAQMPSLPIVVVTAQDSSDLAVRAMRAGANDVVIKPIAGHRLLAALDNATGVTGSTGELRPMAEKWAEALDFAEVIGSAPIFRRAVDSAMRAAETPASILIEGESGVGKEVLAQAIHRASPRSDKALITVNCGAIPANLVESELFGHERGAFTGAFDRRVGQFAAADGGTIFLDEIGDLPADAQVKLLRVLQSGEIRPLGAQAAKQVSVRIIAATNRRLSDDVARGRFREDLFYRLAVVPITLPPLRERSGDIPALVEHLLSRIAPKIGAARLTIDRDAIDLLRQFNWPGNVRQLQNVLFRAAIFCERGHLGIDDFPHVARGAPDAANDGVHDTAAIIAPASPPDAAHAVPLFGPDGHIRTMEEIEGDMIRLAIGHYRGRMTEVARRLQIGRSTLYRKLGELGIDASAA